MWQRIFNTRVRLALYGALIAVVAVAAAYGVASKEQLATIVPLVMALFGLGMAIANVPEVDPDPKGKRYADTDGDGNPDVADEFDTDEPAPF